MNKRQIEAVFEINPLGFSLRASDEHLNPFKTGFSVAITDNKTTKENLLEAYYKLFETAKILNLELENLIIGGWRDGENFYLDLALNIENKSLAFKIARQFNQKAIYSFKNNKVLEV